MPAPFARSRSLAKDVSLKKVPSFSPWASLHWVPFRDTLLLVQAKVRLQYNDIRAFFQQLLVVSAPLSFGEVKVVLSPKVIGSEEFHRPIIGQAMPLGFPWQEPPYSAQVQAAP